MDGACRVTTRIFGSRRSTGTTNTRAGFGFALVSAAARRPAAPDAPGPTSSDEAYPRSRHARLTTETTTPEGVASFFDDSEEPPTFVGAPFPKPFPSLTASSSSATRGANETSTVSASSLSAPAPGSKALGARHSLSGSRATATTSPSIARFIASRPEMRMSHPSASHAMEPSHGECLVVRSAPWCRDPPATPAATDAGDKCSAKATNEELRSSRAGCFEERLFSPSAPSPSPSASPRARFRAARDPPSPTPSSSSSSSAEGATRSARPFASFAFPESAAVARLANSRQETASTPSSRAFFRLPRSLVSSTTRIPGTALW